jgi:hypothetical protein
VDLAEDYILIIEAENMLQRVYTSATTPFKITSIPSNIKVLESINQVLANFYLENSSAATCQRSSRLLGTIGMDGT